MKHIGQILLVAALVAWGGTAMAVTAPFEYECSCGAGQPNPSAGCLATQKMCDLGNNQKGKFPLILGFPRSAQVVIKLPTFTCPTMVYNTGDAQCVIGVDANFKGIPDGNNVPTLFSPGQVSLKKTNFIGDAEYDAESAALAMYLTELIALKDANNTQIVSNPVIDPNYLIVNPPVFGPVYFPSCVNSTFDHCIILHHIDDLVNSFNAGDNSAKYAQDGGTHYIKFNGSNPTVAVQQVLDNLALMKIDVVKGKTLTPCAATIENDPVNVNVVGTVQGLLNGLSPYMQGQDWCVATNPPPAGSVMCEGPAANPTITPLPATVEKLMITTAVENADLDAALASKQTTLADVKTKMACYEEVLMDYGKAVYRKVGTPVQPVNNGNNNNNMVAVSDQCKSNVTDGYDCAKMVRLTNDQKTANNPSPGEALAFVVNGGKFNQMVWFAIGGGGDAGFALLDPMDVNKVMICNNALMTGIGHNVDGSDQRDIIISADAKGGFSATKLNVPAVPLLKKVMAAHFVLTAEALKNNAKPASCDLIQYLKDAGAKDTDFSPIALFPAGSNTLAGVSALDDKLVLAFSNKDEKTGKGTLKGFGLLRDVVDFRALPAEIAIDEVRIVARTLVDGTEVVAFSKDPKIPVAIRCVLPDVGNITCEKPSANNAEFGLVKGVGLIKSFYDHAQQVVKDKDLATQIMLMAMPMNEEETKKNLLMGTTTSEMTAKVDELLKTAKDMDANTLDGVVTNTLFAMYGYKDQKGSVIVTPMSTIVLRKADQGLNAQVVGTLPGASVCAQVDVDRIAGPDLLCLAPNGIFAMPIVNLPPKCDGADTATVASGVQLTPTCMFQQGEDYPDQTYQWKLEQKVGDNWVDVSSVLKDPTAQNPVAIMPNDRLTPMGKGKSLGAINTGADAANFALFRATGTVTNPGKASDDAVVHFSANVPADKVIGQAIVQSGALPTFDQPNAEPNAGVGSAFGLFGGCSLIR